ncbi:MAG: MazG family protein [Cyanobacteria bacterium J06639_1]
MLITLDARTFSPSEFELSFENAVLISHCDRQSWPSLYECLTRKVLARARVSTYASGTEAREMALADLEEWWRDLDIPEDGWSCYIPPQRDAMLNALARLVDIVATLRSPDGGCPWDRAQTPISLTPYVLEEAYETVAAIRIGDRQEIVQELGDYLFQVVLQAQIFSEERAFSLADVADSISDKLIRRHPHVFGPDAGEIPVEDIKRNWETIKAAERAEETLEDKLHHYATTLPPLMAATKIAKKLVRQRLIASDRAIAAEHLRTALARLDPLPEPQSDSAGGAALGELLRASVLLACHLNLDPSVALQEANEVWVRDAVNRVRPKGF